MADADVHSDQPLARIRILANAADHVVIGIFE
jgi:hypothetical protein